MKMLSQEETDYLSSCSLTSNALIPSINAAKPSESVTRILKSLDKYTQIVDVAIQHSPEITALVWASARFILQVGQAFV